MHHQLYGDIWTWSRDEKGSSHRSALLMITATTSTAKKKGVFISVSIITTAVCQEAWCCLFSHDS